MWDSSIRRLILAALACGSFYCPPQPLRACELCCALCGKAEANTKVCRLVTVEKKITVTCWSCEPEEMCLPGPSRPTCRHWDVACDADDSCSPHCGDWRRYFVWAEWTPCGPAKVKTRKRLMKKTMTKTVPGYKWVVEDLCPECEAACEPIAVPKGAVIPPAPAVVNAKVIGGQEGATPK